MWRYLEVFRLAVSSLVSFREAGDVISGEQSGVGDTAKIARECCPNNLRSRIAGSAGVSVTAIAD